MVSDNKYSVLPSSENDVETIFQLFECAISYQKKNNYNLWPHFERSLIENEIREQRHYKVMLGEGIVCVFSVLYNDPIIWKELDKDPSVYLHRIAVSPAHKGERMMSLIRDWAIVHARSMENKFVRMDTWGDNQSLRDYYISCGFNYLGQQQLATEGEQPQHYGGFILSLFQIDCLS